MSLTASPPPRLRLPVPMVHEAGQMFSLWLLVFSLSTIPTHVRGFRTRVWSESNSRTPVQGSWHTCRIILENTQPFYWTCNNNMTTVFLNQSACYCFTPPSCTKNEYKLKLKWIKQTNALNSNFIGMTTLHVTGSLSVHRQEFWAVHRLWYNICSCGDSMLPGVGWHWQCHCHHNCI